MPNFQTKEKNEFQDQPSEQKPGHKVPQADQDGLRELGQTEFFPRRHEYRHAQHTLKDLMKPGYFDDEVRARLQVGDEIHYCMQGGKQLPSEWVRGVCIVEEKPNSQELPLILAGLVEYPKATPLAGRKE